MENNKQEQIENMIGIMAASNNTFVDVPVEIMPNVAEALYNAGYRKLPKDSAVLSREEYEKLKYTWITDSDAYKKGCKETAKKFVNETIKRKQTLMNPYTDDESECVSTFWIYELAKQFGVEIKE